VIARALLLLLFMLGLHAAAQGGSPPPPVEPLAKAPWYDAQADTWRRVVPQPVEPEPEAKEGGFSGVPPFAYVMYALVALAIVLLAIQLWRLRSGWGEFAATPRPAAVPAALAALPFTLPQVDQDPETALRAALAAGDLAVAVIWLYALQLLRLDGAGIIRLSAGKTNRVYVQETGVALAAAILPLQATVTAFERSLFGHQPPTRAEVTALLDQHRTLLAALPASEADR